MHKVVIIVCAAALATTPGVMAMPPQSHPRSTPQLVADGCGPGYHRNDDDECRPDRRPGIGGYFGGERLLGYRCPRGYHFGRESGDCRPDRDEDY